MRKNNGLKLDLTENTTGSSALRLPNLLEHAESTETVVHNTGENLNSKLPNVVEGSMDYGSERRSSRYMDYEPKSYQDGQPGGVGYVDGTTTGADIDYGDRNYSTRSFDRKAPGGGFERDAMERYDNRIYPEDSLRYDRRDRSYQESDLDAPYDRSEAGPKLRYQDTSDSTRRYSRDLTDYDYAARYAEETLKLDSKKDHRHHVGQLYEPINKNYETLGKSGYESGLKTRDSSYELGSCSNTKYEAKYSVGKMYGTLPRYDTSGKAYDSYETGRSYGTKYEDQAYDSGVKSFDSSTSKYELSTSKSYIQERSKYEPVARYQDTSTKSSYDQTLKISEVSGGGGGGATSGPYQRKQTSDSTNTPATEKTNGYRKNNFEAYGVYSDPEDDHGFRTDKKGPQYTYKGVVVNVTGESSVVDQKKNPKEARQTDVARSPWCRPTILLLLLILLIVVFVFVAGILLYFNCK
uniref:Uncharacterized protein n=1 Tax=Bracon brevicornis TaxID=1563983 RepID=A0A6V7LSZ0_9HYME